MDPAGGITSSASKMFDAGRKFFIVRALLAPARHATSVCEIYIGPNIVEVTFTASSERQAHALRVVQLKAHNLSQSCRT